MLRITFDRQNPRADIAAGTASAFVTIPDGMAAAIPAGPGRRQSHARVICPDGGRPHCYLYPQFAIYVGNTGAMTVATGRRSGWRVRSESVGSPGGADFLSRSYTVPVGYAAVRRHYPFCLQCRDGRFYERHCLVDHPATTQSFYGLQQPL